MKTLFTILILSLLLASCKNNPIEPSDLLIRYNQSYHQKLSHIDVQYIGTYYEENYFHFEKKINTSYFLISNALYRRSPNSFLYYIEASTNYPNKSLLTSYIETDTNNIIRSISVYNK